MERHPHANGVITYTFDSLHDLPVAAHVATRHGGVSPEPWASLNFSVLRGDTPERVQENRRRLAAALDIDAAQIVRCQQVHGTGIAKVDRSDAGCLLEGCDGLVTDTIGLPLAVVFADCTPLVLYDRRRHVLGVCHAGWRGTVNGAATATLWAMQAGYDCAPTDIVAGIGPSIGPASYEVGEEVLDLARARLPDATLFFGHPNGATARPHFDLWAANQHQLAAAGVPFSQIEVSGIDTATHTDDFFSHRAERGRCGLFTMVAWLKEFP
jgi:YfiH family protein